MAFVIRLALKRARSYLQKLRDRFAADNCNRLVLVVLTLPSYLALPLLAEENEEAKNLCQSLAAPATSGGQSWHSLDSGSALRACRDARRQNGEDAEITYWLARSYHKAGALKTARNLYGLAGDAGELGAQTALGQLLLVGDGGPMDAEQARELFEQGAEQGFAPAQNNLAFVLYTGLAGKADKSRAFELYKNAAQAGEINALYSLGLIYLKGDEDLRLTSDPQKALVALKQAGEAAGDPDSLYALASLYERGNAATQRDISKALELYERAAEAGQTQAMRRLARYKVDGPGVIRDLPKARSLLEEAAGLGSGIAAWELLQLFESESLLMPETGQIASLEQQIALSRNKDLLYLRAENDLERIESTRDSDWQETAWLYLEALARGSTGASNSLQKNWRQLPRALRRAVQIELKDRGLYNSSIDGVFGRATQRALVAITMSGK